MAAKAAAKRIVLFNPSANEYPVQFVINGKVASLPAGGRMRLPATAPIVVRFDRGADFGMWEGRLEPGRRYHFSVDARGWRLEEAPSP